VSYFLAGNARGEFWVQRRKPGLDQPADYRIVPGSLRLDNVSLKIQEEDIRRQIAADPRFSPLLKERMERFIQVFGDEIAGIPPERFAEEVEGVEEGESSLWACGGLNDSRWARILNRCRLYFDESELKAVRRFADENRHPPDVLCLRLERRISFVSRTGAVSGLAALEGAGASQAAESRLAAGSPEDREAIREKKADRAGGA
jgi:hypothetical protein